jgi:uncharacterized DUF497 family protein
VGGLLRRLVGTLWTLFPRARLRVRADAGFAHGKPLAFLEAAGVECVLGLAGDRRLSSDRPGGRRLGRHRQGTGRGGDARRPPPAAGVGAEVAWAWNVRSFHARLVPARDRTGGHRRSTHCAIRMGSRQGCEEPGETWGIVRGGEHRLGDPLATTILDEVDNLEERWSTTGLSEQGRVIVVSHTNRAEVTRIIGARRAQPSERRTYESGE